ncbi:septum formation family protein [Nocardiopsis sediminis]|uniref:Septum formation family protein n=1 Tax=Nocardiopsis sediminis TaxID=1778267 RepID=A0ABV8FQP6_9ACTN
MSKSLTVRTLIGLAAVGATVSLSGCGALVQQLAGGGAPPAGESSAPAPATDGGGGESAPPAGDTGSGESNTDIFDLSVGDCVNDSTTTGEVTEIPTIDCAEPHDSEVYHEIQSTATTFDQASIDSEAESGCQAAFESFAGIDYGSSVLYFSWYAPTQESWDSGDREIDCLIYEPDVQTTGTLAGAAR